MSKAGKFLFLFSFLFFAAVCIVRIAYGGWFDAMWMPLIVSILFFVTAMIKEFGAIKEFLTLRTTKHGMNMGVLIVITIVALVCVNFLAVRYEKRFDWTSEKLNSLSDQSVKAAKSLKADTEIVLLYRKEQQQENVQRSVADIVGMYQQVTDKIKHSSYNALLRPDLAQKYEFTQGAQVVYAIQGERKVKIDPPNEEGITRALIKLGRENKKTIYFTMGHGERALDDKTDDGISTLRDELSVTYDAKPLVLFQTGNKVPDDAEAVAVVRPMQQFLEPELQGLRDYARNGGRLFIAIDPGLKHNLAQLTKTIGVEFPNNYVLDLRSQVVQGGPAMVLGTEFSKENEITKAFVPGTISIFQIASQLKRAPDALSTLEFTDLVQTDERTMAVANVQEQIQYKPNGPHTLAISVEGELAEGKEFGAIVFGDSDFIANNIIHNNLNRDLALNSFAWLASDRDLISIRPKEPKGTKLDMTETGFALLAIAFLAPMPLLMFGLGGFFWWRRRAA